MTAAFTSASANKQIRALEEEKAFILANEREVCTYVLSADEEEEPPAYDYGDVRAQVAALDDRVRILRCALHSFNVATMLPESKISIDEALVLMAQLNSVRTRLFSLRSNLPKQRVSADIFRGSKVVEYRYANYDVERAEADYQEISERIRQLQMEIDYVNQTVSFEVDI